MLVHACLCLSMPPYARFCHVCLFACLLLVVVDVVMVVLVLAFLVVLAFVVVLISSGQEPRLEVLDIPKHFCIIHC